MAPTPLFEALCSAAYDSKVSAKRAPDLLAQFVTVEHATGHNAAAQGLSCQAMWGAAMDVGGWLRGLGLGQYEEKFRDNRIDADLLPRLTVDDLKDIGVSVVGDRRRLLDAIAALAEPKPPSDVPASRSKSAPPKGPDVSAERRPITVDVLRSRGVDRPRRQA